MESFLQFNSKNEVYQNLKKRQIIILFAHWSNKSRQFSFEINQFNEKHQIHEQIGKNFVRTTVF